MGVGAGLYMYVVVVQKFTFAISSPDEFLSVLDTGLHTYATPALDISGHIALCCDLCLQPNATAASLPPTATNHVVP